MRHGAREGTLLDAAAEPGFITYLLEKLRAGEAIGVDQGRLEFKPTAKLATGGQFAIHNVRAVDTEQSNTTVLVGSEYVIKLFRRLEPGINPEIEVGRFLTETAAFPHAPGLLGSVELEAGTEARSAVAVVHQFVENQGDAWTVTNAYLYRFVEEQRLLTAEVAEDSDEQAAYALRMHQVGRRVAELQAALASRDDLPEFAAEPITTDDIRIWIDGVLRRADRTFDDLVRRRSDLPENDRRLADRLLSYRRSLPTRLRKLLPKNLDAAKIRHHGDFHLGQMVIVKDDIAIIDFEGEPRRSVDRRRKAPAARRCRRSHPFHRLFRDHRARARDQVCARRAWKGRPARSMAGASGPWPPFSTSTGKH